MFYKILIIMLAFFLASCDAKNDDLSQAISKNKTINVSQEKYTMAAQPASYVDDNTQETTSNFFAKNTDINTNGKDFVFIMFSRDGCPWCDRLESDFDNNSEYAKDWKKLFNSYKINFSYDHEHKITFDNKTETIHTGNLTRRYHVLATPTLLFKDKDGKDLLVIQGYLPIANMKALMKFFDTGYYKKANGDRTLIYKMMLDFFDKNV